MRQGPDAVRGIYPTVAATTADGFDQAAVDVGGGVRLRVHHGGSGSPVLLLHGHPRTHTTWHRVAALLVAAGYTVVCPDLRGYGESSKPATTADHAPYSKRWTRCPRSKGCPSVGP